MVIPKANRVVSGRKDDEDVYGIGKGECHSLLK